MFKSILQKMNVEQPDQDNSSPETTPDAVGATPAEGGGAVDKAKIEADVIDALKTVYDPEIPVNIYELGLIYEITVSPASFVDVKMTLTSPSCPVAGSLPGEVEQKVKSVPGVSDAKIELVWEPSWNMSMMSEAAKLQLNMM